MRRKGRADHSGVNDTALKRNTGIFERAMAAVEQIEKQMDASSTRLNEIFDEVRAQSQAIFILIDRLPSP
jgi:hypothetical protein